MTVETCGCRPHAIRPGCPRHDPQERIVVRGTDWSVVAGWVLVGCFLVVVWGVVAAVAMWAASGSWGWPW